MPFLRSSCGGVVGPIDSVRPRTGKRWKDGLAVATRRGSDVDSFSALVGSSLVV